MKTRISKAIFVFFFFIMAQGFGQDRSQAEQGSLVVKKDSLSHPAQFKINGVAGAVSNAARSVHVTVKNTTSFGLLLTSSNLGHGIWTSAPLGIILPNKTVSWESESNGTATGTEGVARFDVFQGDRFLNGEVYVHWNNPFVGSNSYNWSPTILAGVSGGYYVVASGGSGNNANIEFTIVPIAVPSFKPLINLGHTPVTSLSVRIKTANVADAGTDNKVYFSVGPLSWELTKSGSQFERNADETYSLNVNQGNLFTDDIVWLKLEKKGVGGVHGTSDGSGGEWEVAFVELIINGQIKIKRPVNRILSSPQDPFWTSIVQLNKMLKPEDIVANTIRFIPNDKTVKGQSTACEVTANFKMKGISGWIPVNGVSAACITGRVLWKPTLSSDAFATIDIQLEQITMNGRTFNFTNARPRFIRLEYKVQNTCIQFVPSLDNLRDQLIQQKKLPNSQQRITTCGSLKWDTDDDGHFEIHPSLNAVTILN
jgi:hypothetical protein